MTPTRSHIAATSLPRYAHRRGTRGLAAFAIGLLVWMISLWVIAVRYAARAVRPS